jgi:mRNA interferase YafQ
VNSPPQRTANSKRAGIPRASDLGKQFRKDWVSLERSGKYDMHRLKAAMMTLVAGELLPADRRDHALAGEWQDHRECHVGGDFLLIYQLRSGDREVIFVRAGTHSELFD